MKIKNLFFLLLAMPLMMVACNNEGDKVVKDPTVIVTEGTATETSLSFSVTTTNAEVAAWVVVKSNETEPTAAEILNNGTAVEVNSVKQCTASDLEAGVEYVIVAAAKKGKTAVKSAPVKMTTSKSGEGPIDGPGDGNADVDFTATHLYGEFDDLDIVKNYLLVLGDKDYDKQGGFVGGKYYMFNLYSSSANKGVIPAGTYSLATDPDAYQALTISPDDSAYFDTAVNGNMPTPYLEAMVVVSDNKIEATVQLSNGALHKVVYEGSLVFDESAVVETPSDFEATHTATKWLWGGTSQWGNKYQVIGDNFSVDVHFMPENATATTLAVGKYNWVMTTMWDPQEEPYDFEFFTTRTFTVDNNSVPVDGGTAVVVKEGDEYHIELTLLGRDGKTYMIEYKGKITDPVAEGGDEGKTIVLTSFAKGVAVEGYDMHRYAAAADNGDVITFIINNTVAPNGDEIKPCNLTWMSISMAGNDTVFSTDKNIKIDGVSYEANGGSLKIETTDYKNIKLTSNLTFTNGMEATYTFEGKIGGDEPENPGEGGSDEPENPGEGGGDEPENPGEGGGDEPENPGEGGNDEPAASYENWVFTASYSRTDTTGQNVALTMTDGTHTVVANLQSNFGVGAGTYYINDPGVFNVTSITVDGVDVTESSSGTVAIGYDYKITLNVTLNGVKYTGTSTNAIA